MSMFATYIVGLASRPCKLSFPLSSRHSQCFCNSCEIKVSCLPMALSIRFNKVRCSIDVVGEVACPSKVLISGDKTATIHSCAPCSPKHFAICIGSCHVKSGLDLHACNVHLGSSLTALSFFLFLPPLPVFLQQPGYHLRKMLTPNSVDSSRVQLLPSLGFFFSLQAQHHAGRVPFRHHWRDRSRPVASDPLLWCRVRLPQGHHVHSESGAPSCPIKRVLEAPP